MKYVVIFYQCSTYTVEAESEEEAFDAALPEFLQDARRPVARTDYDDVEIRKEE